MSTGYLYQNWGLAVAGALLLVVLTVVWLALYRRSARGQLAATTRALRRARRQHARAAAAVRVAEKRRAKLQARSSTVKPRVLTEAGEALEDARSLAKIAHDRVLIAANHVRRVIFEEHPPTRHAALRKKHLPDDGPDGKPFTF